MTKSLEDAGMREIHGGEVEMCWAVRYLGGPALRTVEPQRVREWREGGRCVLCANKTCGHATEVDTVVGTSTSS